MTEPDKAAEVYPGVVVDSRVMHGVPVIKGTRIPARLIVGQLAGGESIEAIMEAYALTEEQCGQLWATQQSDSGRKRSLW